MWAILILYGPGRNRPGPRISDPTSAYIRQCKLFRLLVV